MKKSELKKYIREEIKSTLTVEDTQQDIKDTEELTVATQNLKKAKEEAGIEENGEKDHWADYTDIGMFYLEAHGNMYQGKEQKLTDSQYEKLGKKIVDQLYDGDVGKAYDETYKAVKGNELKYKGSVKEEIPNTSMLKINNVVKSASTAAKAMMDFYNQMAEKEQMDFLKNAKFKLAIDKLKDLAGDEEEAPVTEDLKEVENVSLADLEEMGYDAGEQAFEKVKGMFKNRPDFQSYKKGYMQGFIDNAGSYGLSETVNEDEDGEVFNPDAKVKKTKGLAKAKEELALLTREMKSLAKKYSKAEGADKEKLVKILKDKTKLKKELESILDNKKI